MLKDLVKLGTCLGRAGRMMVGLPDYEAYVAHSRSRHPGRMPMSYQEFIRERQEARYNGGAGKCC